MRGDSQNGKEEQYKAPLNSRHLITRIASGADISYDVEGPVETIVTELQGNKDVFVADLLVEQNFANT